VRLLHCMERTWEDFCYTLRCFLLWLGFLGRKVEKHFGIFAMDNMELDSRACEWNGFRTGGSVPRIQYHLILPLQSESEANQAYE